MRRTLPLLFLGALLVGCGDEPVPEPSSAPAPTPTQGPRRRVEASAPEEAAPDATEGDARVGIPAPEELLERLTEPTARDDAERLLNELPEGARIELLREGLSLPDDLAYQAALRVEHHRLDADESARMVALLLPHVFDASDEVDFEELRSALGSSEIGGVLQEMREHPEVAGERTLLGALHRQLRAEHLPALVEMALSRHPAVAEQALEEIAIVVMHTNAHRHDVARLFAGRADEPESTGAIPADLVVALRAIPVDERLGDVRRSMFLAWALRWLRDVEPQGSADSDVLVELAARAGDGGLGEWEVEQLRMYVIVELTRLDPARLDDLDVRGEDAQAALRLARLARGTEEQGRELLRLAAADPLAMALAMELDPFLAPMAFETGLAEREPGAALDWADDVYRWRFILRLGWDQLPSLGVRPRLDAGIDAGVVVRLASRYREVRGSHAVGPYLDDLASGRRRLVDELQNDAPELQSAAPLYVLEGPRLVESLRARLASDSERDRHLAGELLTMLGDPESEGTIVDRIAAGDVPEHALLHLATWASPAARARMETLLPRVERSTALETRAALAGVPPLVANEWVFGALLDPGRANEKPGPDAVRAIETLEAGDAVGALLGFLDARPDVTIDGIGRIGDPRVIEHLRIWVERREDGRAHWAIGELAIAGDPDGVRQMREVVQAGRYRWVDDASAEALFVGGGGVLSFWIDEAESNCCRAVPVRRVFEEHLRIDVGEEMGFEIGRGVTLAEWLRWRLGEVRWLTPAAGPSGLGAPGDVRALVRSELLDAYVPALR